MGRDEASVPKATGFSKDRESSMQKRPIPAAPSATPETVEPPILLNCHLQGLGKDLSPSKLLEEICLARMGSQIRGRRVALMEIGIRGALGCRGMAYVDD